MRIYNLIWLIRRKLSLVNNARENEGRVEDEGCEGKG